MATILERCNKDIRYSVIFDDDDRVAYAYLMHEGLVVGDVWLYNRGLPPDVPEWRNRANAPFRNPCGYVREQRFSPVSSSDEVAVEWNESGGVLITADIFIRGELIARLAPGMKPGWSRNAIKDGPLAQVLRSDE